MIKDLFFCLQEAALDFIFDKSSIPKNVSECYIDPPCGCNNPGQNIQCEDCIYLEACLSNFKREEYLYF